MAIKGGYIAVDCTGIDLTGGSTPQEVVGIWDKAKAAVASGKPIVAEHCVYGSGKPVTPVQCFAWYIDTDEIVVVGATLHIHIKDDDTLTILDVAGT